MNTLSSGEIMEFAQKFANSETTMNIWRHIPTNGLAACSEREMPQGEGWEVLGAAKLVSSGRCDSDPIVPLPPSRLPNRALAGEAIIPVIF